MECLRWQCSMAASIQILIYISCWSFKIFNVRLYSLTSCYIHIICPMFGMVVFVVPSSCVYFFPTFIDVGKFRFTRNAVHITKSQRQIDAAQLKSIVAWIAGYFLSSPTIGLWTVKWANASLCPMYICIEKVFTRIKHKNIYETYKNYFGCH